MQAERDAERAAEAGAAAQGVGHERAPNARRGEGVSQELRAGGAVGLERGSQPPAHNLPCLEESYRVHVILLVPYLVDNVAAANARAHQRKVKHRISVRVAIAVVVLPHSRWGAMSRHGWREDEVVARMPTSSVSRLWNGEVNKHVVLLDGTHIVRKGREERRASEHRSAHRRAELVLWRGIGEVENLRRYTSAQEESGCWEPRAPVLYCSPGRRRTQTSFHAWSD